MLRRLRHRIENLKKLGTNRLDVLQDDLNGLSSKNSLGDNDIDKYVDQISRKDGLSESATILPTNHHKSFKKLSSIKKKKKSDYATLFDNNRKVMNQMKRERTLQSNTGAFLTRTVYDSSIEFIWYPKNHKNYIEYKCFDDISLPLSVRWPSYSERSKDSNNTDGKMNIDIFLKYAVDMTQFEIGEVTLHRLFKTQSLQEYYLVLFWFIKVRFFQQNTSLECELSLLSLLRLIYMDLVEDASNLVTYSCEKDTIYKYLPITLANAIFYSFFYLFPASQKNIYKKIS